jgi:protein-disulfide isomerase
LLEKYPDEIKLVIKHFPLRSHKMAQKAATAALAAHQQGKFWEYHSKLFENYKSLSDNKLQQIAKELGLDEDRFQKDQKLPEIQKLIKRDVRNAQKIGVRGTPTIYLNGKQVKNRSFQNFVRLIENELKKVKIP